MKRIITMLLAMAMLMSLSACVAENTPSYDFGGAVMFDPEYSALIGRSDIAYTGRISIGTQGMPVANGRLGGPVWQPNDKTLTMQINHTDVFTFSDSSAESKNHSNEGGGGIGRFHIGFGDSVFGSETENYLSLYEGKLYVTGNDISAQVYTDMDSDVIVITVTDNREAPKNITIDLTMLRDPLREWGEHKTVTELYEEKTLFCSVRP